MKMKFNYAIAAVSIVLLMGNTGVSRAGANDDRAEAVLAMAKASSGGAAWDAITAIRVESALETGGEKGHYSAKASLKPSPRESVHLQVGAMQLGFGWDGTQGWDLDPSGAVKVQTVAQEIAERRSAVYSDLIGYFRPGRLGASLHYVGKRQVGADHYEVLSIVPQGGAAFELWINNKTHRIERQVATTSNPLQMQLFSDFRTVGGVTVPFAIRTLVKVDGKEAEQDRSSVTTFELNPALNDADFAMPSQHPGAAGAAASAR
jgi:hypothetical protein